MKGNLPKAIELLIQEVQVGDVLVQKIKYFDYKKYQEDTLLKLGDRRYFLMMAQARASFREDIIRDLGINKNNQN